MGVDLVVAVITMPWRTEAHCRAWCSREHLLPWMQRGRPVRRRPRESAPGTSACKGKLGAGFTARPSDMHHGVPNRKWLCRSRYEFR